MGCRLLLALALLGAKGAQAQSSWPERAIRVVLPFPPVAPALGG